MMVTKLIGWATQSKVLPFSAVAFTAANAMADASCVPKPPYKPAAILDCFHPEGGTLIDANGKWSCDRAVPADEREVMCIECAMMIGTANATYDGELNYAGRWTKRGYKLEYTVQTKVVSEDDPVIGAKVQKLYTRLLQATDTAPIPPNDECWMRQWKRWDLQ